MTDTLEDHIAELEAENARLRKGLAPVGYVVVPKEPTERMLSACDDVEILITFADDSLANPEEFYRAMIAASQEDAE